MIKRACDVVVATLGLFLTAPLIAAIALALRIAGRGPVVHWSPRLGQDGRVFHLVRFRTMIEAPPGLSPTARLTPVGRFIWNYSLDDLPSLVHVLRGDLSLIGPRPRGHSIRAYDAAVRAYYPAEATTDGALEVI